MEDFLKFLFVAAIIVIGLVRQFKKEAGKSAESKPNIPVPNSDIEEFPAPPFETVKKPTKASKKATQKMPLSTKSAKASYYPSLSTRIDEAPPTAEVEAEETTASEFTIHSVEEARRAIIWSEILQRKY